MKVWFDEFVFDTECHELLRGDEPIHLQPKAFQLLEYLIRAAPAAISREHLYDLLWGEMHVVEANLRNLVADVRCALGDCKSSSRYIHTVHRFGYRFVGHAVTERHPYRSKLSLVLGARRFPLNEGPNIVGRDPLADVHIDSAGVSRVHAAIIVSDDEAWLEDRDSKNGTFVGRERISRAVIVRPGDTIRIGPVAVGVSALATDEITASGEFVAQVSETLR